MLFRQKKEGFYILCGIAIIVFFINIANNVSFIFALIGAVMSPGITYYIAFVKNGMTNMSAEAVTSLIVSIGFGIFINLLWIVDSKTWITDYGKRKCIWSYWCGEIVLLLLVVALENMNQLAAASAILGVMAAYIVVGIWWVSRKL